MREQILSEIRRIAEENGGVAPGRGAFTKITGISPAKWSGVYWARWGDALLEAGFAPRALQVRRDSTEIVGKIAEVCRKFGRLPTTAEIRLERKSDQTVPNHTTINNHFPSRAALIEALRELANSVADLELLQMLPPTPVQAFSQPSSKNADGIVYLLKSGLFYKVGRSDNIERRIKEVSIALPESVNLIHAIRTDDPAGIEAYWHRRFGDKRANGEWFNLSSSDVKAFTRRTFQ